MIILTHAEKVFDKIKHPFMIKTLNEVGVEGMYLDIVKAIYDKPPASIILTILTLKAFSLLSGRRQVYSLSLLLFNLVPEVLEKVICQEKVIKGIKIKWEELNMSLFVDDMILYIKKPKDFINY